MTQSYKTNTFFFHIFPVFKLIIAKIDEIFHIPHKTFTPITMSIGALPLKEGFFTPNFLSDLESLCPLRSQCKENDRKNACQ